MHARTQKSVQKPQTLTGRVRINSERTSKALAQGLAQSEPSVSDTDNGSGGGHDDRGK